MKIPLLALCALTASASVQTDIAFATAGGETLKLDVHVPDGAGPFPTAILVHGGGWTGGHKQQFITPLFDPLTKAGYVWFSVDYRLAPKHKWPACGEDVEPGVLAFSSAVGASICALSHRTYRSTFLRYSITNR